MLGNQRFPVRVRLLPTLEKKKTRMRSNDYDDGDGNNDGDCDGDSDSNNDNLLQFFCFTNFIFVLLFTARCKAALFEWTS